MRATCFLHHRAYAVSPPFEAPAKSVILGILFISLHGSKRDELKLQHQQQHKAKSEKLIETQLRWERYFLTIFITGSLFFKEPWCSSQCTYLAELVAPHNWMFHLFLLMASEVGGRHWNLTLSVLHCKFKRLCSSCCFGGGKETLKLDAVCYTADFRGWKEAVKQC